MIIKFADSETFGLARELIAADKIVAFRTDTFYGLGVNPLSREAVALVRQLKGGEQRKPTLVIISDEKEATRFLKHRSPMYDLLSATYFPGALTIVDAAREEVPEELTAGTGNVGLRLPDDEQVREFVKTCGGALTATSANPANESPARTAKEVWDYFQHGISLIIDSGEATSAAPSTVIDVSRETAVLIREGVVPFRGLEFTLRRNGYKLKHQIKQALSL